MSKLFSPIQIKNLLLRNRIVMSPMCQYSSQNGYLNDWHYIHYVSRAIGGCAAIIQEATAVVPEGRITYADLGIWDDKQIKGYSKLTADILKNGSIPGIQLAHAGRKASCNLPWLGGKQISSSLQNGWKPVAPSPIPFNESSELPKALKIEEIKSIIESFRLAAKRSIDAGFQILEIHAAHGYLIHQFLSPLSNHRTDEYGGSFENRCRLLLEIVDSINPLLNENISMWVRISATEWVNNGWNIEDSVRLSNLLKERNIDIIDVSTGGNIAHAKIPVEENYQIPFSEEIKYKTKQRTGGVGLISRADQAELVLSENKCDLVFIGRELLRNPYFPLKAQIELNEKEANLPPQYIRSFL